MARANRIEPRRFRYSSPVAACLGHLRYSLQNVAFLLGLLGLLLGGIGLWAPFVLFVVVIVVGNFQIGVDVSEPANPPRFLHDVLLRAALPLLLANAFVLAHYFTTGDPFHFVAGLDSLGLDFEAARASTSLGDKLFGLVAQGFYWGVAQTAAHELSHRVNSPLDLDLSDWIGALALDPALRLHHPLCHHRYVGLRRDPGTARRGETLYRFAIRSTIGNTLFAARAEAARLRRMKRWTVSPHNRFIAAWAICVLYFGVFFAIAGWAGGLAFLGAAAFARLLFDSTAYVEHYGLFRLEGEAISDRLSWDVYSFFSNTILYNAARHADHHLHPMRHCADLKIQPGAPRLSYAYIALVAMSFIPPLYRRVIQPHLDGWDRGLATPAHLAYMRENDIPHAEPLVPNVLAA
ncbi:fatty acid desaturase [Rhodoblastus sp.]|uniref:fatty acid desaturase n=1 Tax=Rhodoblastus sp. TaxID=1962975 RepID=UPI0035B392B4